MGDRFDATWPRIARVVGVAWGLGEWTLAQRQGRPMDQGVIAFAVALAALPSVLGRRGE